MTHFKDLVKRAEKRKGGKQMLNLLLPPILDRSLFKTQSSNVFLALMTKGVFQSGFVWRVIENKWDNFETAFLNFDCQKLLSQPDEKWDAYAEDKSIVRNVIKIQTVRDNAEFILNVEQLEGKSFGQVLDEWPASDLIGLWDMMKKNGSRLGGMTGQYFLRRAGKDSFLLSQDVVRSLQEMRLDIKDNPTSKRDFKLIQQTLNEIHQKTKLPYTHISKILAYSSGENYEAEHIASETTRFEEKLITP